ncbi:ParB/RepB/Spo0J family partition protein [Aliishimia ponticola]|uniref:ParB/RepB/Spo0J family partition protein n=1 Tax=Aliishimia ponticola TaxID=2499833 RepID=A0A4S4N993_9RHOB|nr:ParB/RepB/Spo0J family partition protein [Aliishimia ponticola]THH34648.1 ParB/RepB/Spo0J family partition protein [Aliishimia ponticola]
MSKNEKKRGLGRGLSALMSDVTVEAASSETVNQPGGPQYLPIEFIEPNPDQPRKRFTDGEMSDLVSSIREKGIIQPLIVRQMSDTNYQLVAGERRWRAAQQANLHEVPVVVRDFTDVEVIEIAIIENVQRADLNPIEEAAGYRHLMDGFGHTQEKLAEALGKSRSYIANLLRLLQLPASVQALLEDGKLTSGHARALITAPNAEELAQKIVAEGLSVREVEALVKKQAAGDGAPEKRSTSKKGASSKDADTVALEGDLSAAIRMRVSINHNPGNDGGSMTIQYKTLDDLDELCRVLSGG